MATSFVQQETWARLVFDISVAAFVVGEFSQAVKQRRGASRADLRGEVVFRVLFFVGAGGHRQRAAGPLAAPRQNRPRLPMNAGTLPGT